MHTVMAVSAYDRVIDRETTNARIEHIPARWIVIFLTSSGRDEIETFYSKAEAYACCNYLNGGQHWQPLPEPPAAGKDVES